MRESLEAEETDNGCMFLRNACDQLPVYMVTSNNIKVKVKVKFTLEQATKAQRGNRGIALLFI
jgi:hypothetical protein